MRQDSPRELWADHSRSLYGQRFDNGKTVKVNKKINYNKNIHKFASGKSWRKWDKGLARIVPITGQLGWYSKGTARDAERDFLMNSHPLHYIRRYLCTECSVHLHSSSASPLRVGFWVLIYADPCLYQALSVDYAPFAHPRKLMDTKDYSLWAGGDSNGFHL